MTNGSKFKVQSSECLGTLSFELCALNSRLE